MEKELEILKKEYPLICDMSFEWGWKSCEEAMKPKTCKECKLYYMESNKKSCPYGPIFCVLSG